MRLDLGEFGHRLLVARSLADGSEDVVERAEDGLRPHEGLLIPGEPDATADEGVLRIHRPGGDADGGVPVLLHPDVLGVGGAGTERRGAVGDLEVVGDVALRPVGDDLGDADRVVVGELAQRLAVGDLAGESRVSRPG